jgi:hypothetical protein
MIARAGSGWQTTLADLSLILFMVTGAALSQAPQQPQPAAAPRVETLPALAEPVAVWRAGPDAPPLREWLANEGKDPGLRLTILASRRDHAAALALAETAGRPARLVLEAEQDRPLLGLLTYDQSPALARGLQHAEAKPAL